MSRRIQIDRRHLESAIAFCQQEKTLAAQENLRLLVRLRKLSGQAASRIAAAAGCSRSHAFAVVRWVNARNFAKLTRSGSFRRQRLLTDAQKQELAQKLGTEFGSAADVQAWYGKDVSRAVANGWCRKLGFSFRKARLAQKADASPEQEAGPQRAETLELTEEEIAQLRKRQATERDLLRIPAGELRIPNRGGKSRRRPNPVLRIEAVILLGTAIKSVTEVANVLECSRSDVRRWRELYLAKGVEGLCANNPGGRPRKAAPDSLLPGKVPIRAEEEHPIDQSPGQDLAITSRDMVRGNLRNRLASSWCEREGYVDAYIVFLYGVRGCGKSTLVRAEFKEEAAYFDCENPEDLRALQTSPELLSKLDKPIIILDEVGQCPNPADFLRAAARFSAGKKILAISSTSKDLASDGPGAKWSPLGSKSTFVLETEPIPLAIRYLYTPFQLQPLLWEERQRLPAQRETSKPFEEALLRPGIPGLLRQFQNSDHGYREWAQAVFDRDVRRHCNCEASKFPQLLDAILSRSGQAFDSAAIAAASGLDLGSVAPCVESLLAAGVINRVRFLGGESTEGSRIFSADPWLAHQCCCGNSNAGNYQRHLELLWKHLVLLQLRYLFDQPDRIYFWSANGDSVDFVVEAAPKADPAVGGRRSGAKAPNLKNRP